MDIIERFKKIGGKIVKRKKKISILKELLRNPDDFTLTASVKNKEIVIVIRQNEEDEE